MSALTLTPQRSDILHNKKRRAETMARLQSELIDRGVILPEYGSKRERKAQRSESFRKTGDR